MGELDLGRIITGLLKHFKHVTWRSNNDITTFVCTDEGLVLNFPFYDYDLYRYHPYDIVNAIWEYIVHHVFVS